MRTLSGWAQACDSVLLSCSGVLLGCCTALLMAGCGSAPLGGPPGLAGAEIAQTSGFTLAGRISVNYGTQNVSGKVQWTHEAARDDIALASPLGTQVARLLRDGAGVTLTDSEQGVYRAADAETLTQERLGWRLPLTGLADWVRGRAHGSAPQALRRDEQGRIAYLDESGWRIEYAHAEDAPAAASLPRRLIMRYLRSAEPLEIRLVIDQWGAP